VSGVQTGPAGSKQQPTGTTGHLRPADQARDVQSAALLCYAILDINIIFINLKFKHGITKYYARSWRNVRKKNAPGWRLLHAKSARASPFAL